MADDIVTRLRNSCAHKCSVCDRENAYAIGNDAADLIEAQQAEIDRLRTALALACGELSTTDHHRNNHPELLMQQFLEEARRG